MIDIRTILERGIFSAVLIRDDQGESTWSIQKSKKDEPITDQELVILWSMLGELVRLPRFTGLVEYTDHGERGHAVRSTPYACLGSDDLRGATPELRPESADRHPNQEHDGTAHLDPRPSGDFLPGDSA